MTSDLPSFSAEHEKEKKKKTLPSPPAIISSGSNSGHNHSHSHNHSHTSSSSSAAAEIRTTNTSAASTNTSTLHELRAVPWGGGGGGGGHVADTETLTSATAAADTAAPAPEADKVKADFGLSGALAKDVNTGNMYNGVVLKWTEPLDSAKPTKQWRLYVVKNGDVSETLHLHRQSAYLFGRDTRVADVVLQHESCSKQHAVLQYRAVSAPAAAGANGAPGAARRVVKPYIMDLGSTHKTFLNGVALEDARYYELRERDVLRFAGSTRDYILLHEESAKP